MTMPLMSVNPPHSYGEVPASYAGGGVRSHSNDGAYDPCVADCRDTSPYERGGLALSLHRLPRLLDDVLDLLQRLRALGGPAFLVVLDELDRRHRRHVAGQLAEVDVRAGRAAEGRLQDHLARGLGVDEVDERIGGLRVRPALDDA